MPSFLEYGDKTMQEQVLNKGSQYVSQGTFDMPQEHFRSQMLQATDMTASQLPQDPTQSTTSAAIVANKAVLNLGAGGSLIAGADAEVAFLVAKTGVISPSEKSSKTKATKVTDVNDKQRTS